MRMLIRMLMIVLLMATAHALSINIPMHGRLYDSTNSPLSGEHQLTFSIYNVENGGTPLWSESKRVIFNNGIFETMLGDTNPLELKFDEQYWVEIEVDGDTLSPRIRMGGAPYAFAAKNSSFADECRFAMNSSYAQSSNFSTQAGFAEDISENSQKITRRTRDIAGDFVIEGLSVIPHGSSQSSQNLVIVEGGAAYINGSYVKVQSTTLNLGNPDAYNPMWVIVWVNESGGVGFTNGNPSPNPAIPSPPQGSMVLGRIWRNAGDLIVDSNEIVDCREFRPKLRSSPVFPSSPKNGDLFWNSSSSTLWVYNGSGWMQISSPTLFDYLIPKGMIAMFNGSCPTGWRELTQFRGRFPVGAPPTEAGGTYGDPWSHKHTVSLPSGCLGYSCSYYHPEVTPGTYTTSDEMPPYIKVVFCEKL